MKKEKIYQLASQLEDALSEAMEFVQDEATVRAFMVNKEFAASQPDKEIRQYACEIATTYDAIRFNVINVTCDDYEFKVELKFFNTPF